MGREKRYFDKIVSSDSNNGSKTSLPLLVESIKMLEPHNNRKNKNNKKKIIKKQDTLLQPKRQAKVTRQLLPAALAHIFCIIKSKTEYVSRHSNFEISRIFTLKFRL